MTASTMQPSPSGPPWQTGVASDLTTPFALPPDRSGRPRREHRAFVFGAHEVSVARREVLVDGVLRTLQPRPFDVLVYLIEHRDRVVSTDELLDHIWKDEFVQPGSLAAAVMRIRKALLETGQRSGTIIRTHQGIGYRFVAVLDDDTPPGTPHAPTD